jgi:hypothetical protein
MPTDKYDLKQIKSAGEWLKLWSIRKAAQASNLPQL